MERATRLALARQTYVAALEAVREHSTARTWIRLLRAARNLREASTESQRVARRSH
jgi:hypothetical protein